MKTVIFVILLINFYSAANADEKIINCPIEQSTTSGLYGCYLDTEIYDDLTLNIVVDYGTTGKTNLDVSFVVLNNVYTEISVFPRIIFTKFPNLKYFIFNGAKCKTIGLITFEAAKKLENLTISSNELTILKKNTFYGASTLKQIILEKNKIATIESGAFAGMSQVLHLNLRYNRLATLNASTFTGLTNLKQLHFGNNYIKSINAAAFTGLSKLEDLNFSYNPLTYLNPTTFNPLVNLIIVRALFNKLRLLPGGLFAKNPNLNWINLKGNQLQVISYTLFDNLVLNYLGLNENICINKFWSGDTSYVVPLTDVKTLIEECVL
jgi:Leucine-rich repeat (LRR) protein